MCWAAGTCSATANGNRDSNLLCDHRLPVDQLMDGAQADAAHLRDDLLLLHGLGERSGTAGASGEAQSARRGCAKNRLHRARPPFASASRAASRCIQLGARLKQTANLAWRPARNAVRSRRPQHLSKALGGWSNNVPNKIGTGTSRQHWKRSGKTAISSEPVPFFNSRLFFVEGREILPLSLARMPTPQRFQSSYCSRPQRCPTSLVVQASRLLGAAEEVRTTKS